ncbi:MFS transporter [Halomarina oriensis]|uniref:MFS transporter n=1 Tax=Halomarina oriensis TaxID=671145 RepID=A0A6B0GQQ2_9EURY|nr:MFS transporter [Halomarina oriensis]MWG34993.1 MFS transporter [Halomarina oriensis]
MRLTGGRARAAASQYDVLLAVSGLWFVVQFLRYLLPPLFPTFRVVFGVGPTATGALFSALMVGYAAVQFPAGTVADRVGGPSVLAAAGVAFGGAAVLAAAAPTFAVLFVAAVLVGVTTGPHKTVAVPLLSRRYPDRPATALGVMDTIGQAGGAVAPLVVAASLSLALGWRAAFVVGAGVALVTTVAFVRCVGSDGELSLRSTIETTTDEQSLDSEARGRDTEDTDAPTGWAGYRAPFADRRLVGFLLVTMLFSFAWNAVSAFLPLYLVDAKGVPPAMAGLLYGGFFAVSVTQAAAGPVGDRVGPFRTLVVLLGVAVVATAVLVTTTDTVVLVVVVVVAGLGFHGFRPVRDAHLMTLVPSSGDAGVLGIVRTLMLGAGALSPVAVGYVASIASYDLAFGGVVAVLAAAVGLALLTR